MLKQSLKDSTLVKSPIHISSEVKRLKEVNDTLHQNNENSLQENSSRKNIIQLLIKNKVYLKINQFLTLYQMRHSKRQQKVL